MPKYLVTSGSYFTPFTYDELAKPIMQMQEAHNAAQDAYDTLSLETNALGRYISDNPDDSQAKAMYDSYMNKLTTLQNNLWQNGYTAQTRRDLSAARAGYANDITRLGTAIKNRQERSKAYWDTKHKNPDLIMGVDPGVSGLNYYLNDDNYGQNYYMYSGQSFMNEVGTDAKARANEMLRDPQYMRDPRIAGYITRISQEGFTSGEVTAASSAVRASLAGDDTQLAGLDPASSILAEVLMSHLESTGARGNVSPEEFNRLLDYGSAGLSQAIGRVDMRELNDKQWDYNRQVALQNMRQAASSNRKSGAENTIPGGGVPYTLNSIPSFMQSKGAEKMTKVIADKFINPFENPITITNTDGAPDIINSPADANRILSGLGRDSFIQTWGVTPDTPLANEGAVRNQDGTVSAIRVRPGGAGYGSSTGNALFSVERKDNSGKWVKDDILTEEFNIQRRDYVDRLNAWQKNNNGINLTELAVSDKDREKLYKKYNIPADVPFEDVPYILATQAKIGYVTPATIAGATDDMQGTRENYANIIMAEFGRAPKHGKKNKVAKTSESAFYPVDGYEIADEGETDINKVLTKPSDLIEITVLPEDILKNKVRINASGRTYAINPSMLGNNMNAQIQKLRVPVEAMMLPIFEPSSALTMSSEMANEWCNYASYFLGDYMRFDNITPATIVRNPALQQQLRTAVTHFMDNVIADARDDMNLNNMQVRGNTSTKATGYNEYIEE